MKIFGIGLPRTATTSLALATLELGFRTCHTCFKDKLYDQADAFCDTPVYTDYPSLDYRYPGSKFILTWRDPDKWLASFDRNLRAYLERLQTTNLFSIDDHSALNWRCYMQIFGSRYIDSAEYRVHCYKRHRDQAEQYFRDRPRDFLLLDIDNTPDLWAPLCRLLEKPHPKTPFPASNAKMVDAWKHVNHPLKIS